MKKTRTTVKDAIEILRSNADHVELGESISGSKEDLADAMRVVAEAARYDAGWTVGHTCAVLGALFFVALMLTPALSALSAKLPYWLGLMP